MDNQENQKPQEIGSPQPTKVQSVGTIITPTQQNVTTPTQDPTPPLIREDIPETVAPEPYSKDNYSNNTISLTTGKSGLGKFMLILFAVVVIGAGCYLLVSHMSVGKNNTSPVTKTLNNSNQNNDRGSADENSSTSIKQLEEETKNPINSNSKINAEIKYCTNSPLICSEP